MFVCVCLCVCVSVREAYCMRLYVCVCEQVMCSCLFPVMQGDLLTSAIGCIFDGLDLDPGVVAAKPKAMTSHCSSYPYPHQNHFCHSHADSTRRLGPHATFSASHTKIYTRTQTHAHMPTLTHTDNTYQLHAVIHMNGLRLAGRHH